MFKENHPFLSDEFLDEVAKEINQLYGGPEQAQRDESTNKDSK